MWRRAGNFAKQGDGLLRSGSSDVARCSEFPVLALHWFALAGALANGYQVMAARPAGFGLLQNGVATKAFAAVPFLVFAAPFIIMRNTLRGARIERRRFEFVMMATIIAGFWSLMSGTFFLMTLRAAGLLA